MSRTLRDGATLLGAALLGLAAVGISHSEILLLAEPIFLIATAYCLGRFGPEDN